MDSILTTPKPRPNKGALAKTRNTSLVMARPQMRTTSSSTPQLRAAVDIIPRTIQVLVTTSHPMEGSHTEDTTEVYMVENTATLTI